MWTQFKLVQSRQLNRRLRQGNCALLSLFRHEQETGQKDRADSTKAQGEQHAFIIDCQQAILEHQRQIIALEKQIESIAQLHDN